MRATPVRLHPGRVYRTRSLSRWGANSTRLADRLVHEGRLERLAHGLFYAPRRTRYGSAPPNEREMLRALLGNDAFVFTGSQAWNGLGLGSTAVLPVCLVYNHKRTGKFDLGGQRYWLRRVAFPSRATPEWYVVDLLENLPLAGMDALAAEQALARAFTDGRFDRDELAAAAATYGTQRTRDLVARAGAGSAEPT